MPNPEFVPCRRSHRRLATLLLAFLVALPAMLQAGGTAACSTPTMEYDGSLESMLCIPVDGFEGTIEDVDIALALSHRQPGDLTVKVVSPNTVQGVLNRPRLPANPDDGTGCCGSQAWLLPEFPIIFDDDAKESAEFLGPPSVEVICREDGVCRFSSAPESIGGNGLSAFAGEDGRGTWQICIGDSPALPTLNPPPLEVCGAAIAFNGQATDLGVEISAPAGVSSTAPFEYEVVVKNFGPADNGDTEVTVELPAAVSYLGDACGGNHEDGVWRWQTAALANGTARRCKLQVSANAGCSVAEAVASVRDSRDLSFHNNTARHSNLAAIPQAVEDGGFEAGPGASPWLEFSSSQTPLICTEASCDLGGSRVGPRNGSGWLKFMEGGQAQHQASVSQRITVPANASHLEFWLEIPRCVSGGVFVSSVLAIIDGTVLLEETTTDRATCGGFAPNPGHAGYQRRQLAIDAFADDDSHILELALTAAFGEYVYAIDDVQLLAPACDALPSKIFSDGFESGDFTAWSGGQDG